MLADLPGGAPRPVSPGESETISQLEPVSPASSSRSPARHTHRLGYWEGGISLRSLSRVPLLHWDMSSVATAPNLLSSLLEMQHMASLL